MTDSPLRNLPTEMIIDIEHYEKMEAVVIAAMYHVTFPHDDTMDSLRRAVDALPREEVVDET